MKRALVILIIICALSSCLKVAPYTAVPQIKFGSVSSSYVTIGGIDTITFTFTDGDGDVAPNPAYASIDNCITGGDSSVLYRNYDNIILFPSNDCTPGVYASPALESPSGNKNLSGQIKIYQLITSSKCLKCASAGDTCGIPSGAGNPQDTVTYTIYLRDLAGHLSNAIKTTPVITGCQ